MVEYRVLLVICYWLLVHEEVGREVCRSKRNSLSLKRRQDRRGSHRAIEVPWRSTTR